VINRILAGMEWIVGQQVRILSMSLGLRGFDASFQVVVDALRAANILPVFAVGNEFANTSRSPGNYPNVLSVGAMDKSNRVADFSGSQQFNRPIKPLVPDLVAPGVGVLSSLPGGKFGEMGGSSMATPHVAGLAALLLQANPNATAVQLEQAIVGSCTLPAGMPQARGNRGVPDAVQAFLLLTGAALPAAVAVKPMAKPRRRKAKARAATPRHMPIPRRDGAKRIKRAAAAVTGTRKKTKKTKKTRKRS
jgi:subtilisin family serine protease